MTTATHRRHQMQRTPIVPAYALPSGWFGGYRCGVHKQGTSLRLQSCGSDRRGGDGLPAGGWDLSNG